MRNGLNLADDDIIRGGLDIVTDQLKKINKPEGKHDPRTPMAARLINGMKKLLKLLFSYNNRPFINLPLYQSYRQIP